VINYVICYRQRLLCRNNFCVFVVFEEVAVSFTWELSVVRQVAHWRQIFHGMGREYDSMKQYKVEEMINFHCNVYNQLIDSILSSAIEADGVERRFKKIKSFWMEREFRLSEHVLWSAHKSGQMMPSTLTCCCIRITFRVFSTRRFL